MTVKQQTRYELVMVSLAVGVIVAVVVAAAAAAFGRLDLAADAGFVASGCFVVFAFGCFAAWAQSQEPLVECSECHRLNEDSQLAHIGSNRKVCAQCLHPTKWAA